MSAGSEGEIYLRVLQVAGLVTNTAWSVRPFSPRVLRGLFASDSAHPWQRSLAVRAHRRFWIDAVTPQVGGIYNSRFPYGINDGPLWAGRGLTTTALAGVQGGLGPLQFTFAPQLFRAENAAFPIVPTGRPGSGVFTNARSGVIDLPQRFGDQPYSRLDPGNSSVSLALGAAIVGFSTANETWGPAVDNPYLLGDNAAGFAHGFVGTDGPVTVGAVSLSLRILAGRLDQSPYSQAVVATRRLLTGFVGSVGVRAVPGLEIGVARLFQDAWPDSGLTLGDILGPLLKNPLKARLALDNGGGAGQPDNQLASVFARWSFPASRVAVYGELGREDNAYDARDLILEPDHDLTYLVGLERVWPRPAGALMVVRAELLNSSISHLNQVRDQAPLYIHASLIQGHTQRGQLLGAPAGYGGGGTTLGIAWYDPRGRHGITWRRMDQDPSELQAAKDVIHALTFDWLLLRRRVDLLPEATLAYNLNRAGGGDVVNLRVALSGTLHW